MRYAYLGILFSVILSASSFGQIFYGSSSVPAPGKPLSVKVSANKFHKGFNAKKIKVKVFPHDLRNDWVHGKADDGKVLTLKGKFLVDGKSATSVKAAIKNSNLYVSVDGGPQVQVEKIRLKALEPIRLLRKRNPEKTHAYNGLIDLHERNGEILAINTLSIEAYLRGVVPKESVSTWPIEALKAQAVAARSYAYYHLLTSNRRDYDVDDTARFQVYAGVSAAMASTDRAIKETAGQVLTHNDEIIVAFFHAYSGGRTDSAKNIFGNEVAYCQGIEEIFSRNELKRELKPSSRWIVEWTTDWSDKKTLLKKIKASSPSAFADFDSSKSYHLSELEFNPDFESVKTLNFEQNGALADLDFKMIRKTLGWSNFPAYHFRLQQRDSNQVSFKGHGWGHHVGLSQWGAFMMAKFYSKSYKEILNHYYSDVNLTKL